MWPCLFAQRIVHSSYSVDISIIQRACASKESCDGVGGDITRDYHRLRTAIPRLQELQGGALEECT